MKRAFFTTALFALLLLCSGVARGQKTGYMPVFPDGSITFNVAVPETCYSTDPIADYLGCVSTQRITGPNETAMLQGNEYKFFNHYSDVFYVREDTLTGRIFRYYPELDTEVLVCDMSLSVGDTFRMPDVMDRVQYGPSSDYWFYYYSETNKLTVVDSVAYVEGRKIIYLKPFGTQDSIESTFFSGDDRIFPELFPNLRFIEGVGPTYSPFGYINAGSGNLNMLLCVYYGDSLIYMRHPILGCEQWGSGIYEYPSSSMNLYPNPANDVLNVVFEGVENPQGVITVINMAGIVVQCHECSSTVTQLDVSRLKTGIYMVCFRNEKGRIVKKFVKI